ncbi:MAG: hypothetical protein HY323_14395 [Betaproteobacteria bacterium]|nr:hypothetical protein [Betaproteobacteria bacterium]
MGAQAEDGPPALPEMLETRRAMMTLMLSVGIVAIGLIVLTWVVVYVIILGYLLRDE